MASIVKQLEGEAWTEDSVHAGKHEPLLFPFRSSKPEWLYPSYFSQNKPHPDVPLATGIKFVFETFLVDPQNTRTKIASLELTLPDY